jgi:tetratricopeptide (TPR) repeat protein
VNGDLFGPYRLLEGREPFDMIVSNPPYVARQKIEELAREVKDYDGAITEFTKAIESNPDYEGPYWGRGTAYNIKGDYDRAIGDYTKAIELNPKYAAAYYYRGDTWDKKNDLLQSNEQRSEDAADKEHPAPAERSHHKEEQPPL